MNGPNEIEGEEVTNTRPNQEALASSLSSGKTKVATTESGKEFQVTTQPDGSTSVKNEHGSTVDDYD